MEKPRVFANPINKKINNSQELFYGSNDENRVDNNYSINDILKKINNIFNSSNHVYKSRVLIKTKDKEITCDIVGKTGKNLLTLDGKTVRISDILDIKKI